MKHLLKFNESNYNEVSNFLLDFGMFITLNLSKVDSYSINDNRQELNNMMKRLREPILNGKNYSEVISDMQFIKNPKILSAMLLQIRNLLIYIEPRIVRFVKDCDTKNIWLNKIKDFKKRYKNIIL